MRTIPDNAKKVFSGILFDVWQWQQKMFDGTFQTFEKISREYTTLVFAIEGDKIMLIRQTQPQYDDWYWDFIGGRVPRGKDMLEQGKKELLEESGMIAHERELLWTMGRGSYVDREVHYYIARDLEKVADQNLDPGGEKIELHPVSFEKFIELVLAGDMGNDFLRANILEMKLDGTLEEFRRKLFR